LAHDLRADLDQLFLRPYVKAQKNDDPSNAAIRSSSACRRIDRDAHAFDRARHMTLPFDLPLDCDFQFYRRFGALSKMRTPHLRSLPPPGLPAEVPSAPAAVPCAPSDCRKAPGEASRSHAALSLLRESPVLGHEIADVTRNEIGCATVL
jgi:hypothetical protein